jgi:hypothetical protein
MRNRAGLEPSAQLFHVGILTLTGDERKPPFNGFTEHAGSEPAWREFRAVTREALL